MTFENIRRVAYAMLDDSEIEHLSRSDYAHIVVNAIGDGSSAIPVVGAFLTMIKNIGMNIAITKQTNRIIKNLQDLSERVSDIENKFLEKKDNDEFNILFFRAIYYSRDELDEEKRNAFVNTCKNLIEKDLPFDITKLSIDTLATLLPFELKLLKLIFGRQSNELKKNNPTSWSADKVLFFSTKDVAMTFGFNSESQKPIRRSHEARDKVEWALRGLEQKGVIKARIEVNQISSAKADGDLYRISGPKYSVKEEYYLTNVGIELGRLIFSFEGEYKVD